MDLATEFLSATVNAFEANKRLADRAVEQVPDDKLHIALDGNTNSIAVIMKHVAGNLTSRWTDFLTSDGEKPWRNRDEEFAGRTVSREVLLEKWEDGWRSLFTALDALADDNLNDVVTIREQPLAIHQALHRSLAHTSYHIGQIVYVAKAFRGSAWRSLSIPRGASASFMKAGDPMQRSATRT